MVQKQFFSEEEYRTYNLECFFEIACSEVPKILSSLKEEVYPTYKAFVKDLMEGKLRDRINYEANGVLVSKYSYSGGAVPLPPVSINFYIKYSPEIAESIFNWRRKWHLPKEDVQYTPHVVIDYFIFTGLTILGRWYMDKEELDLASFWLGKTKSLAAPKNLPEHLKTFQCNIGLPYEADTDRKVIERDYKKLFRSKLKAWLDERENFIYSDKTPNKRVRSDGREQDFRYLAHYMVLRKRPEQIAEEFGRDEKNIRKGIKRACKILQFDRKSLKLPRRAKDAI